MVEYNTVYEVAINDSNYQVSIKDYINGKRVEIWRCKFYQTWKGVIERCYSSKQYKRGPSYLGCKVCKEWLTFSNFKKWMEQQDWEGKHLDKDLLGDGKLYSPDTCCFLPRNINMFIRDSRKKEARLPLGVTFNKRHKKYAAQGKSLDHKTVFLGYYSNPEAAHEAWKNFKFNLAQIYAEELTDERSKAALKDRYT